MDVIIDGVRYVPVSEAHVDARKIEGALIKSWWGDSWEKHREDALRYLRVIVSDSYDEGEGKSIPDFVAEVIAGV